jgi:hypothetical protein
MKFFIEFLKFQSLKRNWEQTVSLFSVKERSFIFLESIDLLNWSYDTKNIKKISDDKYTVYLSEDNILFDVFELPDAEEVVGKNSKIFICQTEEEHFIDLFFERDDIHFAIQINWFIEDEKIINVFPYIHHENTNDFEDIVIYRYPFIKEIVRNFLCSREEYRLLILTGDLIITYIGEL